MEDDTNSVAVDQAALAYYVRPGYAGVFLACQKPAREGGSLGGGGGGGGGGLRGLP